MRTRAKNPCLAKIRTGLYRKRETERKTTKEKEKTEQLLTASQPASQPGKLNNAKRETEKLMCVKMKESKAPIITWATTQNLHQSDTK